MRGGGIGGYRYPISISIWGHSHHLADRVQRTPHDQEAGQLVDEHGPHPRSHRVGLWRPEVDVQHQHRHTDAAGKKIGGSKGVLYKIQM